jgi:Mn2+/Fe2+ NRAMP family transporter
MAIDTAPQEESTGATLAPWPGSHRMPRWHVDELIAPPRITWRTMAAMLGPGIVAGGAAIGGGEWLLGPEVTARYGGAMLWLATISILGQVLYNIEISRYTLYSGEPIFTGKFRTPPGPKFWLTVYMILDFGSLFPYLAASAATPVAALYLQRIPDPEHITSDQYLLQGLAYAIFLLAIVPLLVGGKVYNSLKAIMLFKIVTVLGFLLILAVGYSQWSTWREIATGFVRFGTVPVVRGEDANGNGVLDPGEDWDGDGRLDGVEPLYPATIDTNSDGKPDAWEDRNGDGKPDKFQDLDGDGIRDGDNVDNIFISIFRGDGMPIVELSLFAALAGLAAIAGNGGLTNTPISNYTRDQGWGMGWHVGAIPSAFGGHNIKLSHVGSVFQVDGKSLPRWKGWYRHVVRDQLMGWMPACFIGLALPSMLSVEFLARGTPASEWTTAGMTADGVRQRVTEVSGAGWGDFFWFMTLFSGFLVLAPSMAATADGVVRRWVDVFWTSSPRLRALDPKEIRRVYFTVLAVWVAFGLVMLTIGKPRSLILVATQIMNFALAFSCWHTLWINTHLLPRELRPGWAIRIGLFLFGVFFAFLTLITTLKVFGYLG